MIMTREEQIMNDTNLQCYVDKNRGWIHEAFKDGVEWADKTMIEKACEWLSLNMKDVAYFGMNGDLYKPEFIQEFKRAMEE